MTQSNTAADAQKEAEAQFKGQSFQELFESSTANQNIKEGSIVKGVITALEKDVATIDIGLKSEGRVPLKEFTASGEIPELNIGDEVEVALERYENRQGEVVLSRERALREESWRKLQVEHAEGRPVEGVIFGQVKGGYTVDVMGTVAFLPGSQVDVRPIKDISYMVGQKQPFVILKMDEKRGNIVVSRRAIVEEAMAETKTELLKDISLDQELEGIVKNLTNYGAFIDLGGLDGLLHVTDISWKRITHPSEVLKIGDKIKVKVIKFDDETKRISLGMKQLEANPWEDILDKFPIGSIVKGKITGLTDYGAFVELEGGVEGMVHSTEFSWTKKDSNPANFVKEGETTDVMVLDVDIEKNRISLGIKQCQDNPWKKFEETYKVSQEVDTKITRITDFGFFVQLDGGIEGLVHYSDLSWDNKKSSEELAQYQTGQDVKVKVLSIDTEKERVTLGVKQLTGDDPFQTFLDNTPKNSVVTCEVTKVQEDGIEVKIGDDIVTFIKRNELSAERSEQRPDRFAVGDRLDAKVANVNKKGRSITLSVKALEIEEQKKAIAEYGSTDSGASLGDILGEALQINKDDAKEAKKEPAKKAAKTTKAKAEKKDAKAEEKAEDKAEAKAEKKETKKAAKKDEE